MYIYSYKWDTAKWTVQLCALSICLVGGELEQFSSLWVLHQKLTNGLETSNRVCAKFLSGRIWYVFNCPERGLKRDNFSATPKQDPLPASAPRFTSDPKPATLLTRIYSIFFTVFITKEEKKNKTVYYISCCNCDMMGQVPNRGKSI